MNFFNHPWKFSFKDLVAAVFIGSFLYFCWKALHSKDALELVETLVNLVGIILGGYFVQEGAAMFFYKSQGTNTIQQPYYGTGQTSVVNASNPAQVERGEAGPL